MRIIALELRMSSLSYQPHLDSLGRETVRRSGQTGLVMTAFKGYPTWFKTSHGMLEGIEFFVMSSVVDVSWQEASGVYWSFSVSKHGFVEWAEAEFSVCCQPCSTETLPRPIQACGHVVFSGDMARALEVAKVIKMGLV